MEPDVPLTYAQQYRAEFHPQGAPSITGEPEDSFNRLLPENIGWHEAPDPIRQSPFWAEGMKIKPDAHMRITENTGLGWWQNWEDDTFHIGKLIGYLAVAMHQGGQRPSVIRANVQEATPITYGSLYQAAPSVPLQEPGPAYSASGFDLSGIDGYPY